MQTRKPRIALMGEFSAGKSTLSNLLLGARPLPEKVTATRLSPVWMSHGNQAPYRIDMDGRHEPVSLDDLGSIPVAETRVIRLFFEADILEQCDLIDFPGISDPNMSPEVWQRMLDEVDAILWCTHATQAWRQSEAAVWETIPDAVRAYSALLVTRFDKLTTERDKSRVLARLHKETDGLFAGTFPISLLQALNAGIDDRALEQSGGIAFLQFFFKMIDDLQARIGGMDHTLYAAGHDSPALAQTEADADADDHADISQTRPTAAIYDLTPTPHRTIADMPAKPVIVPRRVRPETVARRTARPGGELVRGAAVSETSGFAAPKTDGPDLRNVFRMATVSAE